MPAMEVAIHSNWERGDPFTGKTTTGAGWLKECLVIFDPDDATQALLDRYGIKAGSFASANFHNTYEVIFGRICGDEYIHLRNGYEFIIMALDMLCPDDDKRTDLLFKCVWRELPEVKEYLYDKIENANLGANLFYSNVWKDQAQMTRIQTYLKLKFGDFDDCWVKVEL